MAPAAKKTGLKGAKKEGAEQKAAAAGGGLSKFFGSKTPKEESPKAEPEASPAPPTGGLQKLFAAQRTSPAAPAPASAEPAAAAPAVPTVPAAPAPPSEAASASPAGGKPGLSEEQLARIEENRRRAKERQQAAKRPRDEAEASPQQQTPSPPRPAAARAAAAAETGAVATPEKVVQPHAERRQSPAPAAAPAGAGAGAGGRFDMVVDCKAWMQYNSLYTLRLKQLRRAVLLEAQGLWSGMLEPSSFLPEVAGFRRGGCNEAVLIGVVFKELKGRPNVIEQYKDMKASSALGEDSEAKVLQRLSTEDDALWLEDSSMRLQLLASKEQVAALATGTVVGVRGRATEDGRFNVVALCFPRMACPPPLPEPAGPAGGEGPFLALVSGLAFGGEAEAGAGLAEARARAVSFLLGEGGEGEAVRRLVVCGGTFAASSAGSVTKAVLQEADETLARLAASLRVDVMPGRGDPTNLTLPQMPLHPHLFKRVRSCRDFKSVTNPYECSVDGVSVLGHAGQPVEDLLRCTSLGSPLAALAACLRASHLAPTAPDTLPTQPFTSCDPFVLEDSPHILFSGGHAEAGHEWHPSARGAGGTLCACVPAFRKQPAVVLVNLRDPRDVRVREFGAKTEEAPADSDVQMGTSVEEAPAAAAADAGQEEAGAASAAA